MRVLPMLHRNVCVTLRAFKTASHCVQGKVVQALQCAQRHKLTSVDPEVFLSKAAETGVFMFSAGRNNVSFMTATIAPHFSLPSIQIAAIQTEPVLIQDCTCAILNNIFRMSHQIIYIKQCHE